MDPHISSIAALAWCRALGLAQDALTEPGTVTRVDDASSVVRVLRVGDATAIVGPAREVTTLEAISDPARLGASDVVAATGGHAGRTELLGLCLDWIDATRVENPLVSHEPDDLAELLRRCPPDDVTETELPSTTAAKFVLLDDDHHPIVAAGYRELESLVADVRAITVPERRRSGLAATAVTLATHDALDAGLIPMARVRRDNLGARAVAAVSGYHDWGTLVTVRLPTER